MAVFRRRGRQIRTLQEDPSLSRFIMRDARPTGRQLGVGSYGSVQEIEVNGLVCAGKTIHEALVDAENIGGENIAQNYVRECQLMSDLRHPNVTQFLGLCFLPPAILPILVMERLEGSLDDLLENTPNIPLALKRSILEDVARGLLYLHKRDPPIIHRDLTAKNVLLTPSFAAKITDLGNSRIVNLQPRQLVQTMSRLPGTLSYMPPEAVSTVSRYGPSLDIFSFGHLSLFTGLQVFPGDLLEHTYPDPENQRRLVGRSEVERRGVYFERLENSLPRGEQHPFVLLVKQCLDNIPDERPTTEVLLRTLEEMKAEIEGPPGLYAIVKQDFIKQVVTTRTLRQSESEMRRKDEEIRRLQQELEETQAEKADVEERLQNEVAELTTQLNQIQVEKADVEERLQNENDELTTLLNQAQVERDRAESIAEERVSRVQEQLQEIEVSQVSLQAELEARAVQLRDKDVEISRLLRELQGSQTQKKVEQTPLSQLKLPLRLKWRRGKDMPVEFPLYPHVVVIGRKVYIGGWDSQSVVVCDIDGDTMDSLPQYDCSLFGMTAHNSNLVLIGGLHPSTKKTTNELCVWNFQHRKWTHPYPRMTVPSRRSCVISYKNYIIVIGGTSENNNKLSRVELLDTSTGQWYQATPLPEPCFELTSCVIGNKCCLLGGFVRDITPNEQVFTVSLDELISDAVSPLTGASPFHLQWSMITNTPHIFSTALALQGSLLAVGGSVSSDIYTYQTSSKTWVKVGDLSTQRWCCGCTILPNGELLVAGGMKTSDRVDIAAIEN